MRAIIATPEGGDPSTALIEVFDAPPVEGQPNFTLQSSQGYLSPDGWQESDTPLVPEAWDNDNGFLRLVVGAPIVDQLDPLETYHFGLNDQVCALEIGELVLPHMSDRNRDSHPAPVAEETLEEEEREEEEKEAPEEKAAPPTEAEQQIEEPTPPENTSSEDTPEEEPEYTPEASPVPESPQAPVERLSMTPDTKPEKKPAALLEMEPAAPRKSRLPLFLLLVLLIASGALTYRYIAPAGEESATAPLPELPKPDNPATPAPVPPAEKPQDKAPAPAPATPPAREEASASGTQALSEARDLLRRSAPPEETLAAGKALHTPDADARQCDAAFLLLEDAAQKGNAEAMFLVGRFYDPVSDLPRGSIPPDLAQARSWYESARDKGHAESAQALSALRAFVEQTARQGDEEARLLLQNWK